MTGCFSPEFFVIWQAFSKCLGKKCFNEHKKFLLYKFQRRLPVDRQMQCVRFVLLFPSIGEVSPTRQRDSVLPTKNNTHGESRTFQRCFPPNGVSPRDSPFSNPQTNHGREERRFTVGEPNLAPFQLILFGLDGRNESAEQLGEEKVLKVIYGASPLRFRDERAEFCAKIKSQKNK